MGLSHCSEGWITIPYHGREEVAEEEIVDELQYHTSWDWLMPVVEKIEGFEDGYRCAKYNVHIVQCFVDVIDNNTSDEIVNVDANTKIEVVYNAVVEFIKTQTK